MRHVFEVCTCNLQSVQEAIKGGAERIELCAALPLGGVTPSLGMVRTVREMAPRLTIQLLVRPREGNFVYSAEEVKVMERDITDALPYVDGIVCGALLPDGHIDQACMERLVRASKDKPVTFHRAFDECQSPLVSLEQIISSGCRRLLTSGQQPTALEGIPLIRELQQIASDRIIIMPGGGVNPYNAREILLQTGAIEIHGSASDGSGITKSENVRKIIDSFS